VISDTSGWVRSRGVGSASIGSQIGGQPGPPRHPLVGSGSKPRPLSSRTLTDLSTSQANGLGERLRKEVTPADLALLQAYRETYREALEEVVLEVRKVGADLKLGHSIARLRKWSMRMAEFEKNTEMTAELLRDTDGLNKLCRVS
jgi:hypothetical protein